MGFRALPWVKVCCGPKNKGFVGIRPCNLLRDTDGPRYPLSNRFLTISQWRLRAFKSNWSATNSCFSHLFMAFSGCSHYSGMYPLRCIRTNNCGAIFANFQRKLLLLPHILHHKCHCIRHLCYLGFFLVPFVFKITFIFILLIVHHLFMFTPFFFEILATKYHFF